ncbi:MAG: hypothetical protein VX498_04585 [Myxococcota bacterium]|nr:hypothetical protein [Myxococcota bacterium]
MPTLDHPLARVRVASPCQQSWDQMQGDDRSRVCGSCAKHVYNLSGMSSDEALALISRRQGRLCVRFYRRSDGTILTGDCPKGLRAVGRKAGRIALVLAGLLGFGTVAAASEPTVERSGTWLERIPPVARALAASASSEAAEASNRVIMGEISGL